MYQNDPTKCLTGKVRLSFCHLVDPRATVEGGEKKYSVTLLIPKTDLATKADIDSAIQSAAQAGLEKTWHGVRPPILKIPIYDGDGVRPSGEPFSEECKNHWVITASSKQKPECVHISNVRVPLSPTDIYSGMYARVTIRFFAYSSSGNKGVGCGLGNVLKIEEGEPLTSHADALADFEGLAPPPQYAQPSPAYPQYAQPAQYAVPQPSSAYPQYTQPAQYAAPQQTTGIDPITGRPSTGPIMGL